LQRWGLNRPANNSYEDARLCDLPARRRFSRWSQNASKPGEALHRLREPLPKQDVEVAIDVDRRVFQLLSLPLCGGDHRGRVEIEEVLYEQIRVLGLQPERTQYVGREVALVESHNHAGVAADGCSEDMTVPRVGKGQTFNQDLVPGHQPGRDRPIHEVGSAIDLLGREVRLVLNQVPLPLIVDLGAPARAKAPRQGKPHEEIAQRRRIQHAGVS
jgi:hypothetical protein